MWQSPVTITPPAAEPITLDQAKQFVRLDLEETGFDVELGMHIAGARQYVESVTGTRMILQTVDIGADSFADLERFPIGPVSEIVSVSYRDQAGVEQTIPVEDVELFGAKLEWGVRPVAGARWPAARTVKGAVRVRAVVGYGATGAAMPDSVRTGMLLQIRALFDDASCDLDRWIVNDRIYA